MNLGKLKYIIDRQRQYFYYLNTAMILYLFIDKAGWSWWYLLVVPGVLISIWVDVKYVIRKELGYVWGKNPVVKEIMDKIGRE